MLSDKEQMHVVAQALRSSHCDRAKDGHKCQGTCTITPYAILLDCPLCGDGSSEPFFSREEQDSARRLVSKLGLDWDAVAIGSQADFMYAIRELITKGNAK